MSKLFETKLQKFVLLIGGIVVFLRLSAVSYYDRYEAILFSIGAILLTFVLLAILKDYHFKLSLKEWIVKYKKFIIIF